MVISHTAAAQRPSWLLSFAKSGCARTSAIAVDERSMPRVGSLIEIEVEISVSDRVKVRVRPDLSDGGGRQVDARVGVSR